MYIYKITNQINDKIYVGQTIRPIQQRFARHINDAVNNVIDTHFARAIRKYGPENFAIELIDVAETQSELNEKEQLWIHKLNATNPQYGYNETDAIFKCGGNTYQSKTDKELAIIGEKLRKSKLGKDNPHSRAVKCLNEKTNQELFFSCVKDCKEYFGEKHHRFITTRITGQVNSLYRGEWNIAYADEEYRKLNPVPIHRGRQAIVTDMVTDTEYKFPSIRSISEQLNIPRSFITQSIKNNMTEFNWRNFKINILN